MNIYIQRLGHGGPWQVQFGSESLLLEFTADGPQRGRLLRQRSPVDDKYLIGLYHWPEAPEWIFCEADGQRKKNVWQKF